MKKFEDPQYRFEDLDDDGSQFLVKIQIVDLDTVTISQDLDGEVTVIPKPVPAEDTGNGKYRLEPEGDMFRLVATRHIRDNVYEGSRGGLEGADWVLSAQGGCWIWDGSTVGRSCRVKGEAAVMAGCSIDGGGVIVDGSAVLLHTVVTGDMVQIGGSAWIADSRISTGDHGELNIRGHSYINNSTIETDDNLMISGCNVTEAHIRNSYELVVTHQNNWGWLSAYRGSGGELQFTVGCKTRYSGDELRFLAEESNVEPLEREMLDHFLAMVAVSRRGWVDYVAPTEPPKSGEAAAAASDADSDDSSAVPVNPFSDLAQRARDAVRAMNPPLVRPAQLDQYGIAHEGQ